MENWLRMAWMTGTERMQLKPGWLMMRELHVLSERVTFARERACLADDSLLTMWCFDSGATSMSTGKEKIFKFLDNRYRGTLTIDCVMY